jgi:hypothetical protein
MKFGVPSSALNALGANTLRVSAACALAVCVAVHSSAAQTTGTPATPAGNAPDSGTQAAAQAAPLVWHSLVPDTIGRLIIRVDTAANKWVRVIVDTVDGKTPIVTGALSADSVELWGRALDSASRDSLSKAPPKDYRLGEYAMMSRDSTASGPGYKLLVADTTGDQTFAVMIPFSYVPRITNSFARATRPKLPPPTPAAAPATPPKSETPDRTNRLTPT